MFNSLISNINFTNLGAKSKRKATINLTLTMHPSVKLYYVSKSGNSTKLDGFRDPETGLFITNQSLTDEIMRRQEREINTEETYDDLPSSAIRALYERLYAYAQKAITQEVDDLKKQESANPEEFHKAYKPVMVIEQELRDSVNDSSKFMKSIFAQLHTMPDSELPQLNSKIAYADDDVWHVYTTYQSPFKNPEKQDLTKDQKDLVEQFLSVFFDKENLSIFSWMMGTVFLNKPIFASNISRFFLLYSQAGGVGKSTIMKLMTDGLISQDASDSLPEFDTYFLLGDRFRSSDLSRKRLVVYDEAVFNGPLDKENMHNFHGLNEAVLKAFATSGHLIVEKKFKDSKESLFRNIHFILTNFLPVIPENRTDLGRRFLDCQLKPTSMQEKAKQLNDMTVQQMIEYVKKNGQAFINYFADSYKQDPYRFAKYVYSHVDAEQTANDAAKKQEQDKMMETQELQKLNAFDALKHLGEQANCDVSSLLHDVLSAKPDDDYLSKASETQSTIRYTDVTHYPDIHFVFDYEHKTAKLYLNASKSFWMSYNNGLALRELMITHYSRVKRFSQRVFEIPLMTV